LGLVIVLFGCGGRSSGGFAKPPQLSTAAGGPGTVVTVSPNAPCPPPAGSPAPLAEVDLVSLDNSVMAAVEPPPLVDRTGRWTANLLIRLVPPGLYRIEAVCVADIAARPYVFYAPAPFTATSAAVTPPPGYRAPSSPPPTRR
jgi:hypothetical protein